VNGVHDMGGMQDFGPVHPQPNEAAFHAPWEGRVFALNQAAGAWRKWSVDAWRHKIEALPPADYLRMSYYERWFAAVSELLVDGGLVTRAEIESGQPAQGSPKAIPALSADRVPLMRRSGALSKRDDKIAPRFRPGHQVRTRNINPVGHTRLPRYARGKIGIVDRDHGVYVFPDTSAHALGENPQHVYSVRFAARELWGEQASPRDAVYLDLWDDYLDPA
jgi:nitrile hydratase beta subunit